MNHVSHLIAYYRKENNSEQILRSPSAVGGAPVLNGEDYFHFLRVLFQRSKCNRSGCYQYYYEWENHLKACSYHPGRLVGSRKYVSCCRASSYGDRGCKTAYHNGSFYFMLHLKRNDKDHGKATQTEKGESHLFLPPIAASSLSVPVSTQKIKMALPTTVASTSSFLPPI
jgi:hypothetical protein